MMMNRTTFFLLLVLKLANCNINVPRTNANGVRDGSSSISSLLFVDIEKDAIRRITSSLQQPGRSRNNGDRVLSQINGRQSLIGNGGRVTVVPARVDRLRLQPDFSNGFTLFAPEPGLSTQGNTDTARFYIPKNVIFPFITPYKYLQPGLFLTPPPRTSSPTHSNSQNSHFHVTNNFSGQNNRVVPNIKPTTSPDPIYYFINNPTPFSTHVSSSQSTSQNVGTLSNTNSRDVLNPPTTSTPNQIFNSVNRPTPSANIPSQPPHTSISNNEINIPNIRNIVANILSNNRVPVQQFDSPNIFTENNVSRDITQTQPESSLNVHSPISNTLQKPQRKPFQGFDIQPPSTTTQFNNFPPITTLIPNQQISSFNTQIQSNNLNSPQQSPSQGIVIQTPLISTGVTHSSNNINPIQQQLTPPDLDLPKPEVQVQKPHCLLCDLLNTNNKATTTKSPDVVQASSVPPNINNSNLPSGSLRPNVMKISLLQPQDLAALRIIVNGVLFRADPPDIGVHSSELQDPGLFPNIKSPKKFIMIIPHSMLSILGSDVNMNLIL